MGVFRILEVGQVWLCRLYHFKYKIKSMLVFLPPHLGGGGIIGLGN